MVAILDFGQLYGGQFRFLALLNAFVITLLRILINNAIIIPKSPFFMHQIRLLKFIVLKFIGVYVEISA